MLGLPFVDVFEDTFWCTFGTMTISWFLSYYPWFNMVTLIIFTKILTAVYFANPDSA